MNAELNGQFSLADLQTRAGRTSEEKGWWTPACPHPSLLETAAIDWCRECGAIRWHQKKDDWFFPGSSKRRSTGELFMLMVTEIAEAFEEYRKGEPEDFVYYTDKKPEGVPIEIADLFIRMLDYCDHRGIDLQKALLEKMDYNDTRPYRHGGKLA